MTIKINDKCIRSLSDEYNSLFLNNISLNPACSKCPFRTIHYADIILADFWRYKVINKNMNVKNGISLIISTNQHGDELIRYAENNCEIIGMDSKYTEYVFSQIKSSDYRRQKSIDFYIEYVMNGYKYIKKKYASRLRCKYIKLIIKNYLKKLNVIR